MNPGRHLGFQRVIFDCDSTLVRIEGIDELARLKGQAGHIAELTRRAMEGLMPLEQVCAERLNRLRPTRAELAEVGRRYRRALVPEAAEVVAALQHAGVEVFIVSGGLLDAVLDLAAYLKVPAAHVRAVAVELDQLQGEWWDYARHRFAGNPAERYLNFAPSPLAASSGKTEVVRELSAGRRVMLVGDGATDLAAKEVVRLFVGFGGVTRRESVAAGAEVFIDGPGLAPVLPLALSRAGAGRLAGTPFEPVLASGREALVRGRVRFRKHALRERVLRAHAAAETTEGIINL